MFSQNFFFVHEMEMFHFCKHGICNIFGNLLFGLIKRNCVDSIYKLMLLFCTVNCNLK